MTDNHTALASALAAVVGSNNLIENRSLRINTLVPAFVVSPGSHDEGRECLKICAAFHAAIVPAGAMTWLDGGNSLRRADVVLSLQRLKRVIDYSPPDLTATVEAGLSLQEFNQLAKPENQWLPLDPPGAPYATLGAIVACASHGALRFGFGTPRDYVIGLRLAHIDGTESKCGGRVVKNVAGYDMNKLYTGSFGTLAVITEITFKLRPLPERVATITATHGDFPGLAEAAKSVLASPSLQPASVFVTRTHRADADRNDLFIRFIESDITVTHQLNETITLLSDLLQKDSEIAVLPHDSSASWDTINQADLSGGNVTVRLHLPVATLATAFAKVLPASDESYLAADFGTGIIRINFAADEAQAISLIKQMRAEAEAVGGNIFIERAAPQIKEQLGAWNEVSDLATLMRGVKRNFDPEGLLNAGRFVAGI